MSLVLVAKVSDAEFLAVFNRLCVALREPQDDTGITQGVYFDALKDLPLDVLDAGAQALSRETGRRFFPTTAEWRTAAQRVEQERERRRIEPTSGQTNVWRHECHSCEDTGWVMDLTCSGIEGSSACGRKRKHHAHSYAVSCGCRATNRTFIRHHANV